MADSSSELPETPVIEKSMQSDSQIAVMGLPDSARNHLVAVIGEFCGTFLFLFMAFAIAQAANSTSDAIATPNPAQLVMISCGFGFSVAANVAIFFKVSGGQLNPCVSLSLALVGAISPIRAVLLMVTQIIAGMAAAGVVDAVTPGPILFSNTLGPDVSRSRGLFIEAFLTAQLCITVLLCAAQKRRSRGMAPLFIGLSLFIDHLVGVYFTGAGINPARSFGPNVAMASFPNYHYIYWLGPILGSVMAAALYHLLQFLHYETTNPGQDDDGYSDLEGLLRNKA
ncbi:aquaporin-like protein [Lipomyces oligophaga]|uniref:aquaporin-like protein n=1 Tax=Lipomyces oligophaga TaxID=45792 RepID=UPI0034D01483